MSGALTTYLIILLQFASGIHSGSGPAEKVIAAAADIANATNTTSKWG